MAKYVANPVEVDAFVIVTVLPHGIDAFRLQLKDGRWVQATGEMTARYTPKPNDYWVIQADGYVYLNPKEVFERKYRPVD